MRSGAAVETAYFGHCGASAGRRPRLRDGGWSAWRPAADDRLDNPMTKRLLLACMLAGLAVPAAAQAPPALVFSEAHSARLDDAAEAVLGTVSTQARATGAAVEIRGFADPEGGAPDNRALSLARAEHVAHVLRESGVEPGRLRIVARGPIDFALDSQESRRVEIRLVP
jgi:hypothetical protein